MPTVWNGKNGTLRFYQSEMPYILPSGDGGTTLKNSVAKVACSTPGGSVTSYQVCPSLYIGENATGFLGYGLGVYSYFPSSYNSGTGTQKNIYAESAIKVDNASAVLTNVITRWLNGAPKSGIMTLCNII